MPQRREFLTMSAGLLAGASLAGGTPAGGAVDRGDLVPPPSPRGLIVVELSGGNDGLNTLVPLTSSIYRASRPTLAISARDSIVLTDETGLHPSLAPLLPLWNSGEVAFERSVGPITGCPSHATAVEVWRKAIAGRGEAVLFDKAGGLVDSITAGVDAIASVDGWLTVRVSLAGFDTHTRQAELHGELLARLAEGLVACRARCDSLGVTDQIRIVVVSEFGRTVAENVFGGTDHGSGGLGLVVGRGVNPGKLVENLTDKDLSGASRGELRATCPVDRFVAHWCGLADDRPSGKIIPRV